MPRARSASIVSNGTTTARRSSRVVPPSPAKAAAPAQAKPKVKPKAGTKRARAGSVALSTTSEHSEDELDAAADDDDDDDAASVAGQKRKRGTTPRPARVKVVKPRVPVEGINALPTLYPTPSAAFDFAIPPIPQPADAPRRAFVFGNGDFGQHGLGVADNVLCEIKRPRPQLWFEGKIEHAEPAWVGGIAGLECGGMHTLALDGLGRVWSWGINDNAALGRFTDVEGKSEELETQPMLVDGLGAEGFKAVRVAAGDSVSLALSELGEVRCWGSFRASEGILGFDGKEGSSQTQLKPVALPNLSAHTVVQLATGDDHFIALTTKGHVFACGNGEQDQLGRKIIQRHKTHGLTPERLSLRDIVTIGSGSYHSFAVSKKGDVYGWGLNSFCQVGLSEDDGSYEDTIATPTIIDALGPAQHGGARVVEITGGAHHSVFLFSNGEVWACGRCDGNEVGLGANHPEMVKKEQRKEAALKQRAAREVDELALLADEPADEAALKAAENAAQGVPLPNPYIPYPQKVAFPLTEGVTAETRIIKIASGTRHNFAVSSDGLVYSWGMGNTSQLGLGDEEDAPIPTLVRSQKMDGFRALAASTGGQHSVIVAIKA